MRGTRDAVLSAKTGLNGRVIGWIRRAVSRVRGERSLEDEEGQAIIELAVVLPVMLLVATGIGAFGITMVNYLKLVDAVNDGARQLVVIRSQTSDPCATLSTIVINGASSLTASKLSFTFTLNGTTYTGTSCTAGAANLVQGASGSIAVTYPCSLAVYKQNFAPNCTLQAQTTELIQ